MQWEITLGWVRWAAAGALPQVGFWQRGLGAMEEARALEVALVGMGVVFTGLTILFLMMLLLERLVGERPAQLPDEGGQAAPEASVDGAPDAHLVVAIAVALGLERQRREAAVLPRRPAAVGSGWLRARAQEQVQRQRIFFRPRR